MILDAAPRADCSCYNVTSTVQPAYSGYYYLELQTVSSFPVYRRLDCPLYIYNLDTQYTGLWVIGPVPGGSSAGAANIHYWRTVAATSGSWWVYNSTSMNYGPDAGMTTTCSCPGN